jgi:hypothetical protein
MSEGRIDVYPPGAWEPRPSPTAGDIEDALESAGKWWIWGVNRGDDSLETFLDSFERHLSGNVRRRCFTSTGQKTLLAATDGGNRRNADTDTDRSNTSMEGSD